MKWNFIVICVLTLFLSSCSSTDKSDVTINTKYPKPFILYDNMLSYNDNGIVLGSDGYEYLITHYGTKYDNMEHYIDCEKCIDRNKKNSEK